MHTEDSSNGVSTHWSSPERVHYFPRQLITADDMTTEQEYFRYKLRRHNRYLHGWGVVCGGSVEPYPDKDHPWQVRICRGYIITPCGDEIHIGEPVSFDLAGDWRQAFNPCAHVSPCPPTGLQPAGEKPQTVYLAACYAECNARPVRVHPVGCACDETACEYSRIRDSFELVRLLNLPESHVRAAEADAQWCETVKKWAGTKAPLPVPSCPCWPEDNCVVLASITLPKAKDAPIAKNDIQYQGRRVLYSVQSLAECLFHCRP